MRVKVLNEKAKHITGVQQWPYRAVSRALEVIPRTLIQNCGGQAIRTLTALRVHCRCFSSCSVLVRVMALLENLELSGNSKAVRGNYFQRKLSIAFFKFEATSLFSRL